MPGLQAAGSKSLRGRRRASGGRHAAIDAAPSFAEAFPTELGWMAIAANGDALVGVVFGYRSRQEAERALARYSGPVDFVEAPEWMHEVAARLERYAAGDAVDFDYVPLGLDHLTPFARRVVIACRRIPRGQVRTYGELASACGSPGAARAVGSVMAKNRFPIIVPCHRVVGSGGSLGGYSAPDGLTMKRRLLTLEGQGF